MSSFVKVTSGGRGDSEYVPVRYISLTTRSKRLHVICQKRSNCTTYCSIPYRSLSQSVQLKIGSGCASVLNTQRSRGINSSSVNNRYKYLSLRDRISQCSCSEGEGETYVSAMKKLPMYYDQSLLPIHITPDTYLGISSFLGAGENSTARRLA